MTEALMTAEIQVDEQMDEQPDATQETDAVPASTAPNFEALRDEIRKLGKDQERVMLERRAAADERERLAKEVQQLEHALPVLRVDAIERGTPEARDTVERAKKALRDLLEAETEAIHATKAAEGALERLDKKIRAAELKLMGTEDRTVLGALEATAAEDERALRDLLDRLQLRMQLRAGWDNAAVGLQFEATLRAIYVKQLLPEAVRERTGALRRALLKESEGNDRNGENS